MRTDLTGFNIDVQFSQENHNASNLKLTAIK